MAKQYRHKKPNIGEVDMYGKEVVRIACCSFCIHKGDDLEQYKNFDVKKNKCYCNKTKRVGSWYRGFFCKHYENKYKKGDKK